MLSTQTHTREKYITFVSFSVLVFIVSVVVAADFHRMEDFDSVMRQIYGPRVEIVYTPNVCVCVCVVCVYGKCTR